MSPESGGSVPAGVLPGKRHAQAALSGHASSLLNQQSQFFTHHPCLPAPRPAPSLAHLAKVPEGCRASLTELHDQRDGAQQDAWGQGGAVNGGPGHGTVCVCTPLVQGVGFPDLLLTSFQSQTRSGWWRACALTMMALTEQFGTRWEEDVGELGILPNHVHSSQDSLRKSRASDRVTKLDSTLLPQGRLGTPSGEANA